MVYKKFLNINGKKYGPYYYESYRDKNGKIKKKYVHVNSSENSFPEPKKTSEKNPNKRYFTPTRISKNFLIFFTIFLLILVILVGGFFIKNNFNKSFTGFVITDNMTDFEKQTALYNNEFVDQSINTSSVNLEIKSPPLVSGEIINKNKNKRMDFSVGVKKIRLYFDLLNYSEFVTNVAEIVATDNVTIINKTIIINQTLPINNITIPNPTINETLPNNETITDIIIPKTNISIPENQTMNNTLPVDNLTNQTNNLTQPENNLTSPENQNSNETSFNNNENRTNSDEKPNNENNQSESSSNNLNPSDISQDNPSQNQQNNLSSSSQDNSQQNEEQNTNQVSPITGGVIKFFSFLGRVIGIDNNETDSNENLTDNSSNVNTDNIETSQDTKKTEVQISEVQDKVSTLSNDKIDNLTDSSVITAENFDVKVNPNSLQKSEKNKPLKWGYKVKLNDLKFLAKVDVTTDEKISIYNEDTLRVGRNLLSFNDLTKAGYKVRFETPALEIPVKNLSVEVNVTTVVNTIYINNTGEENNINNNSDKNINSSDQEQSGYGITGGVIKFFSGITARVVDTVIGNSEAQNLSEVDDVKYANTITVYFERDFTNNSDGINVGDVIDLDPELIIILATDAEHLDSNRTFIENVYDYINAVDNNYTTIPQNDYLRVYFSKELTNKNDITIYAKTNENSSVIIDGKEVPYDIYLKIKRIDELKRSLNQS